MRLGYEQLRRRRIKRVEVPYGEQGLTFYLRSITALEWMEWLEASRSADESLNPETAARLLSLVLCDEHGNPLFDSEEGVVEISEWDSAVVRVLFDEAMTHCGIVSAPKKA